MVILNTASVRYIRSLLYWGGFAFLIYGVVWRNRRDRVLACEALGVGVFVAALLMWHFFKLSDLFILLSGIVAVFFGVLALYFSLLNWARRRVKSDKAK